MNYTDLLDNTNTQLYSVIAATVTLFICSQHIHNMFGKIINMLTFFTLFLSCSYLAKISTRADEVDVIPLWVNVGWVIIEICFFLQFSVYTVYLICSDQTYQGYIRYGSYISKVLYVLAIATVILTYWFTCDISSC